MDNTNLLLNNIAIVTGGAQGLGFSTAQCLALHGAKVAIFDLDRQKAEQQASVLPGTGHIGLLCDVTDSRQRLKAIDTVLKIYGTIDILVNNAGLQYHAEGDEMPENRWVQVVNVNLNAVMFMCRDVSHTMIQNKKGSIINIGSIASFQAMPGRSVYTATKTAVLGLGRNLAVDWGKYNIRVNTICPGYHDTPLFRLYVENGKLNPKTIKSRIPMKRLGEPDDIGKAIVFFASGLSEYITGQAIMVDGGYTVYGAPDGL